MKHLLGPTLLNTLSLFSVEVGLADEAAFRAADLNLDNPASLLALKSELLNTLSDRNFSWVQALDDGCNLTVYPADSEEEARAYVIELLWKRYFPNEAIPPFGS